MGGGGAGRELLEHRELKVNEEVVRRRHSQEAWIGFASQKRFGGGLLAVWLKSSFV